MNNSSNKKSSGLSGRSAGFTFMEVLVVMAIVGVFAVMGLFVGNDLLRSNTFYSDFEMIVVTLHRARARAISNVNEYDHGLKINGTDYVLFQGNDYTSRDVSKDELIKGNPGFTFTGPTEFVFEQLTGETADAVLVVTDSVKTSTISLNSEGRIEY